VTEILKSATNLTQPNSSFSNYINRDSIEMKRLLESFITEPNFSEISKMLMAYGEFSGNHVLFSFSFSFEI
jgi:hypothetical protein